MKKTLLPRDYAIALLISAAGFVLLATRVAPGVLPGDSGEFQFVPYIWGVPHPTGYPLYVLLGGAWSHLLPIGDVAFRMNLFSALWGSLALGMLYLLVVTILGLGRTKADRWAVRAGGFVGAIVPLASAIFQRQSLVAEVYTMHHLLALLILLTALRWMDEHRPWGSAWLAVALGLGLAHHRSTILLIPGLLAAWIVPPRPKIRWKTALAALAAPLLLYLFIPLRAPHLSYLRLDLGPAGSWNLYDPTLAGFLRFVSGSRFAGEMRSIGEAAGQLPAAWKLLLSQVGWGGMALSVAGIVAMAVRRRWRALALVLIGLASIVTFDLFYGIGDIRDFYGTAVVLLALLTGVGTTYLATTSSQALHRQDEAAANAGEKKRRDAKERKPQRNIKNLGVFASLRLCVEKVTLLTEHASEWIALFAAAALLALYALLHPPALMDLHHHDETAQRWSHVLASPLPDNAILVTNDRDEITPLYYYQLVEGKRTSWQPLYPLIVPTPEMRDVVGVLDIALRSGRPVYTIKRMDELALRFDLSEVPDGMEMVKAMAPPAEPLHAGLRVGPLEAVGITKHPSGRALKVEIYWRVTGTVPSGATAYVHLLDESGWKVSQGRDYVPGWPYHPPQDWRTGEVIRVIQTIPLPSGRAGGFLLMGWYVGKKQLGAPVRVPLSCTL